MPPLDWFCPFNPTLLPSVEGDLRPILVPHIKLEFSHFLFLNSGSPLVLEDGYSMSCVA
jgi:hypothetical protein